MKASRFSPQGLELGNRGQQPVGRLFLLASRPQPHPGSHHEAAHQQCRGSTREDAEFSGHALAEGLLGIVEGSLLEPLHDAIRAPVASAVAGALLLLRHAPAGRDPGARVAGPDGSDASLADEQHAPPPPLVACIGAGVAMMPPAAQPPVFTGGSEARPAARSAGPAPPSAVQPRAASPAARAAEAPSPAAATAPGEALPEPPPRPFGHQCPWQVWQFTELA
eukprot:CAMPEP_0175549088 /NCGR_PEP_ID=MMETSP0096-20121207/31135_1 /TAXON_ID=311494 /ORGANISM="Alexandrium monilatum, Strain CCMP3105" /LENGTH=221 /DNA_ID=CAMNT_0016852107 /DNA_START=98 /DNA_END=762 /DNA_ORIENTATION=+